MEHVNVFCPPATQPWFSLVFPVLPVYAFIALYTEKMADGTSDWLNGWLQTAKEKSSSVLTFMKKDLGEFTNTIQQETTSFVTSTTSSLREKLNNISTESTASKVKRSFSGMLDTVGSALSISPEPDDDDEPFVIRDSEPVVLSRLELQVVLMQRETSTYLIEPPGKLEDYEAWLDKFELSTKREEMTELMSSNAHVRAQYGHLVPSQVSHSLFWHRYFYRVHQLYVAEAKRSALKKRSEMAGGETNAPDELELHWDEEESNGAFGGQQLTPQETDRILSDYQRECEERDMQSRFASLDTNDNDQDGIKSPSKEEPKTDSILRSSMYSTSSPKSLAEEIQADAGDQKPNIGKERPITPHEATVTECDSKDSKDSKTIGMEMSPSSKVSELSNDEEWEKDFDVGVTADEMQKALLQEPTEFAKSQGDDEWEKWQ